MDDRLVTRPQQDNTNTERMQIYTHTPNGILMFERYEIINALHHMATLINLIVDKSHEKFHILWLILQYVKIQ
jgi:hypothetical protein